MAGDMRSSNSVSLVPGDLVTHDRELAVLAIVGSQKLVPLRSWDTSLVLAIDQPSRDVLVVARRSLVGWVLAVQRRKVET